MAPELGVACCLLAAGIQPSGDDWLLDTVDADDVTNREFVYTFDPDTKASISGEEIKLAELVERFNNAEWCAAHDDHPIAYMRAFWNQLVHLRDTLRSRPPSIRMRKTYEDDEGSHTITAIIPPNMNADLKAEVLKRFEDAGE